MRGLKTQENDRFNRFFHLIQQAAQQQGGVFFAFAGEGNEFSFPEMEGEDMSGWLIPESYAVDFELEWAISNSISHLEAWSNYFVWAEWKVDEQNGVVSINIVHYN